MESESGSNQNCRIRIRIISRPGSDRIRLRLTDNKIEYNARKLDPGIWFDHGSVMIRLVTIGCAHMKQINQSH